MVQNNDEDEGITFQTQDAAAGPILHAGHMSTTTYWTARSMISSLFSRSAGKQSQNGATWRHDLQTNLNSGFGWGALRSMGNAGVKEGRERGGYLPDIPRLGRTGKGMALYQRDGKSTSASRGQGKRVKARYKGDRLAIGIGVSILDETIRLCESAESPNIEEDLQIRGLRKRVGALLIEVDIGDVEIEKKILAEADFSRAIIAYPFLVLLRGQWLKVGLA